MNPSVHTLRGRMLSAMVAFAVASSAIMALLVAAFAYGVEDAGFNQQIDWELARQQAALEAGGNGVAPSDPAMRIVAREALPEGLTALLAEEPDRREYTAPSGRHYHFRRLPTSGTAPEWLLYDVTDRLLLRPSAKAFWSLLAAVALILVVTGALVALWLSHRITRPLSALVHAVRSAEQDALDWRPPTATGPAEVAVLSAHLASLMTRLQAFVAREQAFTRDASHEIRTPLAVMRLQLDHLLSLGTLEAPLRASLTGLHAAVQDLERIVGTLLWLAREEARPSQVEPIAIRPLVERAIIDQSLKLDGDRSDVALEIPDAARMTAPRGALALLVGNLIGNAFSHATLGRISIQWDGEGLSICNPFAAQTGGAGVPGGARGGFGLDIARRVAERSGLRLVICTDETHFRVRIGPDPALPRRGPV